MADSVDDRIVAIEFDNAKFGSKIEDTLKSLDKLQRSLDLTSLAKAAPDIDVSGADASLGRMASAVENISSKFSAMGVIGFEVIRKLTDGALNFATNAFQSVLGPIEEGGKKRAENIEQAKFQFQGLGIDVDKAMKSALDAVTGTAFGLGDAAKAAAQLGASGIKAGDQMTAALRGISGAAAMTGSSFSEIADVFTGIAGVGKVTNQDFIQFGTRGLNAAAAIAPILGKTEAQVHEMATNGQIDFATFAAAMDKAFGAHATEANQTYSGSLANVHAALSRLGASFFTPHMVAQRDLFNALSPAIDKVTAALAPMINLFNALNRLGTNDVIGVIKNIDLSHLKDALAYIAVGLTSIYIAVHRVGEAFGQAFREIFPKAELSIFLQMAAAIVKFTDAFKLSATTVDEFKRIFAGLFAVIEIVWTVVKDLAKVLFGLVASLSGAGHGVLGLGASLGDVLVALDRFLVTGGVIDKVFSGLANILTPLAKAIGFVAKAVAGAASDVFDFFTNLDYSGVIKFVTDRLAVLGAAFEVVAGIAQQAFNILARGDFKHGILQEDSKLVDFLFGIRDSLVAIGSAAKALYDFVATKVISFFSPDESKHIDTATQALDNFHQKLKLISTTASAVSVKGLSPGSVDLSGLESLGNIDFEKKAAGLKGFIQTMGDYIRSLGDVLQGYAGKLHDIGVKFNEAINKFFTGSEVVRTSSPFEIIVKIIDSVLVTGILFKANKVMGSLNDLVGSADGILKNLSNALKNFGKETPESLATQILKIGAALGILALSLKLLSDIDGGKLAAALSALTVGLGSLFATLIGLDKLVKNEDAVDKSSKSMIKMSIALRIMASAISVLAAIDGADLAKGLLAASVGVAGLAASTRLIGDNNTNMISAATAIIEMSLALTIMAGAIHLFGSMNPKELAIGLATAVASLMALSAAVHGMDSQGVAAAGLGMVLMAGALVVIAEAVKLFGNMNAGELAKGLFSMFLVLTMISGLVETLSASPFFFSAAAAIPVVAGGLVILAEAIKMMGSIKGGDLAKGLLGMWAALLLVTAAVAAMEGAMPGAVALVVTAGALVVLAHALELMGNLSLKQIATGLAVMTVSLLLLAAAGVVLEAPLLAIGAAMVLIGEGFFLFGVGVAATVAAFVYLVNSANDHAKEFIGVMKYLAEQIPQILVVFVQSLAKSAQDIADSINGMSGAIQTVLITILQAIINVIPKVIETMSVILTALINFISDNAVAFVNMGFALLGALAQGLLNNVGALTDTAIQIIAKFAQTLADNMPLIIDAGVRLIASFVLGLVKRLDDIVRLGAVLIIHFIRGLADAAVAVTNAAADTLIAFLNGMADAIRNHAQEIHDAGMNIASAIVEGLAVGLIGKKNTDRVIQAVKDLANLIPDWARKILGIASPSKVFEEIGGHVVQGLSNGLDDNDLAKHAAVRTAERIVSAFSATLASMPAALDGMDELSPVITPVLDLSQVSADAKGLKSLLSGPTLTPNVSTAQAGVIATTAQQEGTPTDGGKGGDQSLTFIQNNYSPKALSTNDIYRGSRSQIALAKEKLSQ